MHAEACTANLSVHVSLLDETLKLLLAAVFDEIEHNTCDDDEGFHLLTL